MSTPFHWQTIDTIPDQHRLIIIAYKSPDRKSGTYEISRSSKGFPVSPLRRLHAGYEATHWSYITDPFDIEGKIDVVSG